MIRRILFVASFIVFGLSCTYHFIEGTETGVDVLIKTGTICGWCSQNDTLTISDTRVKYVDYKNCSRTNPTVSKSGQLTTAELNELLGKLDFDELKKLELNSCNVCADGCDDWISYKSSSQTHNIRFSRNDPKLAPIKDFVDQLNAIKGRYRSTN